MTSSEDADKTETKEKAKALLNSPSLLYQIKKRLDKDIEGEDENKLLLFIIANTSLMNTPLGAIVTGNSSGGKNHLTRNVLKHFDNVEEVSRITEAAPDRLGQDFTNKILMVDELRGAEKSQASLRVWISEGRLRLLTTTRDDNGKITTEVIETNGVPCFITTTTSVTIDEELLNRLFIISIDETQEQTRKIMRFEAKQFSSFPEEAEDYFDKVLREAQQQLVYRDKVKFPTPINSLKSSLLIPLNLEETSKSSFL